jgi:glutamate carboxypeptidase
VSQTTLTPPGTDPGSVAPLHRAAVELLPWARSRLRQHVEHETPNGDAGALDAFGEALLAGHAEAGADTLSLAGPHGDHVLSCWPGADPTLAPALLLGHHDTVWPAGQLASLPCVDDGSTISGPGALDGKSGLVVAEMAIRILNLVGLAPAQQVRLLVSADTLMGSPTARPYLVAETARAGAVFGLAAPRPDGVLTTGRAGSARVLLRVAAAGGQPASATGEQPASAIDELLDQLAAVRAAASRVRAAVNVGRIGGGTEAYELAELAGAELGVRLPDAASEQAFLDAVSGLGSFRPGLAVQGEALSVVPAWVPPARNPLLDWVSAVGHRHGMAVVGAPYDDPGPAGESAGDTNHAGALGAPTVDGFGGVGRRILGTHAPDERIRIDSLVPRAVLLAALLSQPLPPRS